MAKVKLRATGGLNKDVDPNFLPEGDYIEASNIVTDTSTSGNAGSIKMLESIKATGVSFSGTVKATCQDPDGNIYVLERTTDATSSIYKIVSPFDSGDKTTILTYTHISQPSSTFIPDLKILGDMIMWNYEGDGTPLSFNLNDDAPSSVSDLLLQKQTPNNAVTIAKHLGSAGTGVAALENQDIQFAFRYLYDSGQYSALSMYSQMFKAEQDTDYYTLTYTFPSSTFVDKIESFARVGNNGAWRRIDTRTSAENTSQGALQWSGAFYDALDTVSSNKPFDAVPVNAKHLEVAKNRLFLADVQDDYNVTDAEKELTISIANGYTPSTASGTDRSYLNASLVTASSSETTSNGATYTKPFSNDSSYAIGVAYYDKAMKTRGVEKFNTFNTGKFSLPVLPDITITASGTYSKPSWAEYMQVVYTKNLNKLYSYEGYASNIFFRVKRTIKNPATGEDEERIVDVQNLLTSDLNNSPVLIIDLMSMFAGGHIYNYSDGDMVNLHMIDYTAVTDVNLSLKVVGQEGSLILCEYNDGAIQAVGTLGIPEPEKLYLEIYTPRQQQETESYVFYEYGNLIDISSWTAGSSVTLTAQNALGSKIIGDMVWKQVEAGTYQTKPFFKTAQKAIPIDENTDANVVTTATGNLAATITETTAGGNYTSSKTPEYVNVPISTITSNGDSAQITDSTLELSGFYDSGIQIQGTNKLSLSFSYQYTRALNIPTSVDPTVEYRGEMIFWVYAQVYRIPFDNELNKRLEAEKFGEQKLLQSNSYDQTTASPVTANGSGSFDFDLNTLGIDIAASDQFVVKVWLKLQTVGDVSYASISLLNPSSGSFVTMSLNGNRIDTIDYTVRDTNAKVNATKTKFLVRAISNAVADQQWNTSAGKTSISAADIISTRRTNTIRYSGQYIVGTKINDLNSFFALDSNDLPVENGDIMALHRVSRLQGNGDMLLALCKRESSYILLGEQDLTQSSNAPLRALTANFIGTTRNVGGNLGLQEKLSAINYKGTIYWWDDFNKKVVKFSKDGIDLLSDKFMKSYFRGKSGNARLCYDPFYNIINVGFTSDSISTGYSEVLGRWVSDYSFRTDFSESYGDRMILFKGTAVYRSLESNSGTDYNGFLGASQVNSTIKFVMNSQIPVQPLNVSIQHNCNIIDYNQSNGVKASLLTIGIDNENGQATSIVESNFLLENNRLYAHVLRDANSPNGIIAGDHIVGYINKFLLTLKDKTQPMAINSIDVEVDNISGHS